GVAVENVPVDVAPFVNRARLMGVAATDARRIPTARTYGTGSLVATRTPTLGRKLSPCRERAGPPRRAWPAASPRRLRGRATSSGDSELFGSPRAARRRHLRDGMRRGAPRRCAAVASRFGAGRRRWR